MQAITSSPNRLLQMLPAELQLLSPHLATVELVKGLVLTEAGAPLQSVYLPHSIEGLRRTSYDVLCGGPPALRAAAGVL
jgi:hypothetical protein